MRVTADGQRVVGRSLVSGPDIRGVSAAVHQADARQHFGERRGWKKAPVEAGALPKRQTPRRSEGCTKRAAAFRRLRLLNHRIRNGTTYLLYISFAYLLMTETRSGICVHDVEGHWRIGEGVPA